MTPMKNIQEFRSDGTCNVSFCAKIACAYKVAPKEPLAGPGALKRMSSHFLSCRIFGKGQKLSVCHKLVECYSNLQEQILAHYSSS